MQSASNVKSTMPTAAEANLSAEITIVGFDHPNDTGITLLRLSQVLVVHTTPSFNDCLPDQFLIDDVSRQNHIWHSRRMGFATNGDQSRLPGHSQEIQRQRYRHSLQICKVCEILA